MPGSTDQADKCRPPLGAWTRSALAPDPHSSGYSPGKYLPPPRLRLLNPHYSQRKFKHPCRGFAVESLVSSDFLPNFTAHNLIFSRFQSPRLCVVLAQGCNLKGIQFGFACELLQSIVQSHLSVLIPSPVSCREFAPEFALLASEVCFCRNLTTRARDSRARDCTWCLILFIRSGLQFQGYWGFLESSIPSHLFRFRVFHHPSPLSRICT